MTLQLLRSSADWVKSQPLLFPGLLLALVLLMSALKISGSSVGIYEQYMYGANYHSGDLIAGHPRSIRSDEYSNNTLLTSSQSHNGFARINPDIGEGHDMSVILDAPYKEWSTLFRPQNWPFFVLPFEHAFAMKWWLLGFGLMTSAYLFVLTILPRRRLLAAILSVGLFFSPLIQWWYQSITILPIAYSLLLIVLFIKICESTKLKQKIIFSLLLAYCLVAFALLLYPPFQIPCALVVSIFCLGYLFRQSTNSKKIALLLVPIVISIISAGFIVGLFLLTRLDTVHAIVDTVYPGHRIVPNGHFSLTHYFSGAFSSNLQNDLLAAHYDENQSEASSFFMLWPAFLIPTLYLAAHRYKKRQLWPIDLILISILLSIFTARMLLPLPLIVTKPLLLNSIPHTRLLLGIGLLGLIQMVLLLRYKAEFPKWVVVISSGSILLLMLTMGLRLRHHMPEFLPNIWMILIPVLLCTIAVWGWLSRKQVIGALALALLGIITTFNTNPLYRGLGPITHSSASQAIASIAATSHDEWILVNGGVFTNYLAAQGIPAYSALYAYPQLKIWYAIDQNKQYVDDYNRYAYAFFSVSPSSKLMELAGGDSFIVHYNACDPRFASITRVASLGPLSMGCLTNRIKLSDKNFSVYVYDVKRK